MNQRHFEYDVFLSHASADEAAVRELAALLKRDGLRVWLDEWVIQPGDSIPLAIETGLESSRTLVLLMSEHAFASDWVTLERHTALFRDPTNKARRFVPVRLDDSKIKETLEQFAYVDWRDRKPEQYRKLRDACAPRESSQVPLTDHPTIREKTKVLQGHAGAISGVVLLSDTRHAVSISLDKSIRKWDVEAGVCIGTFQCRHTDLTVYPRYASLSTDGKWAVTHCSGNTIAAWSVDGSRYVGRYWGVHGRINNLVVASELRFVAAAGEATVQVWTEFGVAPLSFPERPYQVTCVALSPDERFILAGYSDGVIRKWALDGSCLAESRHSAPITSMISCPDHRHLICGTRDTSLLLRDADSLQHIATLEGHTGVASSVAVTSDSRWGVSAASDNTLRVWNLESGRCTAVLEANTGEIASVAISGDGTKLLCGGDGSSIRSWQLPPLEELGPKGSPIVRYSNAKAILVGDSGVGKSALAIRLTEGDFKPTASTDAHWATQLKLAHDISNERVDREIWLWDFGGQPDYRLIHQLFMDETAVAILVFNPQSDDLVSKLREWDRILERAAKRRVVKLLVAGRCDRGGLRMSRETIEDFQRRWRYDAYLETSALTGESCDRLREEVVHRINWDSIPWTASPRVFKLLKDEILRLRGEGIVLLRMGELKQQLELRLVGTSLTPPGGTAENGDRLEEFPAFGLDELRAVVKLLAGPGIVWQLDFGEFVLLEPERINAYAAAVIRQVRRHPEEIGCISEEDVLAGKLDYQDLRRLPPSAETIVLRAMHQAFVDHGLCLREHTDAGTQLVFPSYFRRELPGELESLPVLVDYEFAGPIDEIYATLIVRLRHTRAFESDRLGCDAADFRTAQGDRMGLRMTRDRDGNAKISIYFDNGISDDTKVTFIKYVHEHVLERAQVVERFRHYICPHCRHPVKDTVMARARIESGEKDIGCVKCDGRVPLRDVIEDKFASPEFHARVRQLEQQAKAAIDDDSRELALLSHAYSVAREAGHRFVHTPNTDWGVDAEIVLKDAEGCDSEKRVFLQLKSAQYYTRLEDFNDERVFLVKKPLFGDWWRKCVLPVMLVATSSDGEIWWMDIRDKLTTRVEVGFEHKGILQPVGAKRDDRLTETVVTTLRFKGTPFTALSLQRLRDTLLRYPV